MRALSGLEILSRLSGAAREPMQGEGASVATIVLIPSALDCIGIGAVDIGEASHYDPSERPASRLL